jgi:hypothetical protein
MEYEEKKRKTCEICKKGRSAGYKKEEELWDVQKEEEVWNMKKEEDVWDMQL